MEKPKRNFIVLKIWFYFVNTTFWLQSHCQLIKNKSSIQSNLTAAMHQEISQGPSLVIYCQK